MWNEKYYLLFHVLSAICAVLQNLFSHCVPTLSWFIYSNYERNNFRIYVLLYFKKNSSWILTMGQLSFDTKSRLHVFKTVFPIVGWALLYDHCTGWPSYLPCLQSWRKIKPQTTAKFNSFQSWKSSPFWRSHCQGSHACWFNVFNIFNSISLIPGFRTVVSCDHIMHDVVHRRFGKLREWLRM